MHDSGLRDDDMLARSSVVANSTMNRTRGLVGVNSYTKDLGFDPLEWLRTRPPARWLDLCCGSGRALIEAAQRCNGEEIELHGVDLVGMFAPGAEAYPHLRLVERALAAYVPEGRYDLITCVHGFHYLGDKLGTIARYAGHLTETGRLIGHLDLSNIDGIERRALRALLRSCGYTYDSRRHVIEATAQSQPLPLRYLGADDTNGANFTGQPGVRSYYRGL